MQTSDLKAAAADDANGNGYFPEVYEIKEEIYTTVEGILEDASLSNEPYSNK